MAPSRNLPNIPVRRPRRAGAFAFWDAQAARVVACSADARPLSCRQSPQECTMEDVAQSFAIPKNWTAPRQATVVLPRSFPPFTRRIREQSTAGIAIPLQDEPELLAAGL